MKIYDKGQNENLTIILRYSLPSVTSNYNQKLDILMGHLDFLGDPGVVAVNCY